MVIGVLLGASLEPLIDSVIYHQRVAPGSEPGMSTLTVSGRDISVLLDLEERNAEYRNMPDCVIVKHIRPATLNTGSYHAMPTTDVPIERQRVPRQHETDLQFIRRMAQRNGYVFYIEPLTLGVTTAYFGPEYRLGLPQPALSVDMGTASNVNTLNFTNDALAPVDTEGSFVEPSSKTSIPIPSLPSLACRRWRRRRRRHGAPCCCARPRARTRGRRPPAMAARTQTPDAVSAAARSTRSAMVTCCGRGGWWGARRRAEERWFLQSTPGNA